MPTQLIKVDCAGMCRGAGLPCRDCAGLCRRRAQKGHGKNKKEKEIPPPLGAGARRGVVKMFEFRGIGTSGALPAQKT